MVIQNYFIPASCVSNILYPAFYVNCLSAYKPVRLIRLWRTTV